MQARAKRFESSAVQRSFTDGKRGFELQLHPGATPKEVDHKLVRNLVTAQSWMAMNLERKTFIEIFETEKASKRRAQDVVELAMLAPGALEAISTSERPLGLNSDYLIKTGFPAYWQAQNDQFAKL